MRGVEVEMGQRKKREWEEEECVQAGELWVWEVEAKDWQKKGGQLVERGILVVVGVLQLPVAQQAWLYKPLHQQDVSRLMCAVFYSHSMFCRSFYPFWLPNQGAKVHQVDTVGLALNA